MRRLASLFATVFLAGRGLGACLIGLSLAGFLLFAKPGQMADLGATWFDMLNQIHPRAPQSEPVVIVAIDEESIARVGAWPWPRAKTAQLFRRIAAGSPAAVGVDMLFSEREAGSPAALARRSDAPEDVVQWLLSQPSGDDVLASAMATGSFVLGVGDQGVPPQEAPEGLSLGVFVNGPDPRPALAGWRDPFAPLRSLPQFVDVSAGEGVIALQAGFDGVARRTGQVFDVGGSAPALGLALEMLRVASGANRVEVATSDSGVEGLTLFAGADPIFGVATEPNGALRPWFSPRQTAKEIPAVALLADNDELARLEGKLVLVGYTAGGGVDERVTPLEEVVPGVDVHKQTLEAIFDGELLYRPAWADLAETIVAALFAVMASVFTLRFSLVGGVAIGFTLLALPIAVSIGAYVLFLTVLDGAAIFVVTLAAALPAFLAHLAIDAAEQRRAQAAQSRLDGEMAAAKRIQMGILPSAEEVFPAETRFSIAATSEPARTVGGDLYDFFLLDDRRLFFLVGDVSGKGPEASLFMAISKALCKSAALRGVVDIGEIMTQANREIARDNPATMFVTAFAGVLDVETGQLDYCCAGHEPPWLIAASGAERLEGVGGPPLCLLDDFPYPTDSAKLSPGDAIVVVTDGVTEAANVAGELYGVERAEETIPAVGAAPDAGQALATLTAPVQRFAEGAEPSDDLTAMVVIWRGNA